MFKLSGILRKRDSLPEEWMLRLTRKLPYHPLRKAMVLLMLPAFLVGCQTVTTATATRTVCAPWKPLGYSGKKDTTLTVRGIRVHNKTGQNLGCWK